MSGTNAKTGSTRGSTTGFPLKSRRWCSKTGTAWSGKIEWILLPGSRDGTQIGAVQVEPRSAAVLLVVHVYRENAYGEEIVRIISARAAEEYDIGRYQEQAMD